MQRPGEDPSDAHLVSTARRGDREAFGLLFSRHRPMLVTVCRRWLGADAALDDIVQEAALQALLNLERLRNPERFGAWLAGIGLNLCRRWSRESGRSPLSWDDLAGGRSLHEPVVEDDSPEAVAEAALAHEAVRRAIADLPPRQRAAVALFYLAGLTYAETAATLGVQPSAVRTRLHNARLRLRRSLMTFWQEETMTSEAESDLVEVHIAGVWQKRMVDEPREWTASVVLLQERAGGRQLPIWIGYAEGMAMAMLLEKVEPPRPLTYAFLAALIKAAGAELQQVQITRIADDTFYAVAVIDGPTGSRRVDARPSDALNAALAAGARVFVQKAVLAAAARAAEERFSHAGSEPRRFSEQGWNDAAAIVANYQQWMAAAQERRRRRLGGETAT